MVAFPQDIAGGMRMLRKMLGKPREDGLSAAEWVIESNRTIKRLKDKHGFVDWDVCVLRHHFVWAGCVSRMRTTDPTRLTHRILSFKDHEWLRLVEAQNNGRQLHGRYFRDWRWEQPLVRWAKFKGVASWHTLAEDSRQWKSEVLDAAAWWRHNR